MRIFANFALNYAMNLIDTHAHLFLEEFSEDLDEVVQRSQDAGVSKVFLPNVDGSTFERMMEITGKYPGFCFPMIGLHPTSVKDNYLDELEFLTKTTDQHTFYAVGETGIDLYWDKTHFREQQDAFIRQINLAKELHLPIIIHSRNSYDEIFNIMDEHNDEGLTGIFHSFTGNTDQARKIIDYGFRVGIGGIVTFKNSGLNKVVAGIPLQSIVIETDSPYLSPDPKRGKRNEPSHLVYTAQKIAEIFNITPEEVARTTTENALQLYRIKE